MRFCIREKIRTKICSIQIRQPFFLSKIIKKLQSYAIDQNNISINDCLLIRSMNRWYIHRFVISKQGFLKRFSWIGSMMGIKKFFSRNISKIEIINDTETLPVIETENMFACLIGSSLEQRIEDFFVHKKYLANKSIPICKKIDKYYNPEKIK